MFCLLLRLPPGSRNSRRATSWARRPGVSAASARELGAWPKLHYRLFGGEPWSLRRPCDNTNSDDQNLTSRLQSRPYPQSLLRDLERVPPPLYLLARNLTQRHEEGHVECAEYQIVQREQGPARHIQAREGKHTQ